MLEIFIHFIQRIFNRLSGLIIEFSRCFIFCGYLFANMNLNGPRVV